MTPHRLVVVCLILVVVLTAWLSGVEEKKREGLYDRVGIVGMTQPYTDMHYIFASLDCARQGKAPTDYCPEAGYTFIYPKTFYLLLPTGLSAGATVPAVWLMFLVFIGTMAAYLRPAGWVQAGYLAVLLFSPPVLLALERGNIDVAIVSLLVVSSMLLETGRYALLALSAIGFAALLKVYPIAALVSGYGRARLAELALVAAVCGAAFWVQLDQLRFISTAAPQIKQMSWGSPVMFMAVRDTLARKGQSALLPGGIEHVLQIVALLVCGVLAYMLYRQGWGAEVVNQKHVPGLVAGAAVFCFCWLRGANFDYRYLVLLPAIPFLFAATESPLLRRLALLVLACLPPMFWLSIDYTHTLFTIVQELIGTMVFSGLLILLLLSLMQAATTRR